MGEIERKLVTVWAKKACRRHQLNRAVCRTNVNWESQIMSQRRENRVRQAVRLALMTAVSFDASLMSHYAIAADPTQSTSQTTAKTDDLQEIVVTGFRESLQSALNR